MPPDWDVEADVVVVGFGAAGACAALEAAAAGGSVLVLDRFGGGGATALSGWVVYAGRALLRRAAAGVEHAAGQRRGAAAAEPVQDQHRAAGRGRLQGRAGARGAEPDHHHVSLDVPVRHGPPFGIRRQNCNVF